MSARMVLIPSAGRGPATEDLETCGCDGAELECWECGLALCSECARVYWIDGYEVVLCPLCAPALNPRGDE
jgi:hypothetical protein